MNPVSEINVYTIMKNTETAAKQCKVNTTKTD